MSLSYLDKSSARSRLFGIFTAVFKHLLVLTFLQKRRKSNTILATSKSNQKVKMLHKLRQIKQKKANNNKQKCNKEHLKCSETITALFLGF